MIEPNAIPRQAVAAAEEVVVIIRGRLASNYIEGGPVVLVDQHLIAIPAPLVVRVQRQVPPAFVRHLPDGTVEMYQNSGAALTQPNGVPIKLERAW